MTPEEKAKQVQEDLDNADKSRADKVRKDAEEAAANQGERLDKLLSCLDSISKRMDALELEGKSRQAEEGKSEMEGEIEKDKPRELAADSIVRKDSAADLEEIEHYKSELGATYTIQADAVLAGIQSDADRASSAWGKNAVSPWDGESVTAYRRRSAREHQQHSPAWKSVDLRTLEGQSLRNACSQIFADSFKASSAQDSYGEVLREVRRRDPDTGHMIKGHLEKYSLEAGRSAIEVAAVSVDGRRPFIEAI